MSWNPFRKEPKQNPEVKPSGNAAKDSFEDAAARVVSQPGESQGAAEKVERILVDDDSARGVVKAFFWPLAKWDHPAWALSDDEAQQAVPKMRNLLQAITDRYMPQFLAHLYLRHREIFSLVATLGVMYYAKYQIVERAKEAESAAAKERPKPVAINTRKPAESEIDADSEAARDAQHSFTCEICGDPFPNLEALSAHLPCSGK